MKKKPVAVVLAVILLLIILPAISFFFLRTGEKLRSERRIPDFSFATARGGEISRSQLEGNVHVATFLYTRCGLICDSLTTVLAGLQTEFAGHEDFILVTYTIDPDYDTPEVLQDYAARHSSGDNWHFAYGGQEEVFDLALGGYFGKVQHGSAEEGKLKPDKKIALVDRNGFIHGYYDVLETKEIESLREALSTLLNKAD